VNSDFSGQKGQHAHLRPAVLEDRAGSLSQPLCISRIVSQARFSRCASWVVGGKTREVLSQLLSPDAKSTAEVHMK
jgi:hypothetical protein